MNYKTRGKKREIARDRLHQDNLRWGNWMLIESYVTRLEDIHLTGRPDVLPLQLDEEMMGYISFFLADFEGYHRNSLLMGWALRKEESRWYLSFQEQKIPLPVRYAHQVQNVIYYLTGEEI